MRRARAGLVSYGLTLRQGRDHITLATTGGSQGGDDPRSFDHVTLVHVGEGEPAIANLRLDGILDGTGQLPGDGDALCFQASRCGRRRE